MDNGRNGMPGDATVFAVRRLQPRGKGFRAFACVAADATERDVLAGNDRSVIDDVFPRWAKSPLGGRGEERAAVDACTVAVAHFTLKPIRDVPAVGHDCRCGA